MHLDTLLYTEPEVFLRLLLLENFWMTFERKLFCPLTQRTIIIFLFRIKEFGQKFSYFTHCHHEKIKRKTFRVLWHVISIQTNLICRHVPLISSKLSSDNKIWASRIFPSTEKSHNLAIRTPQIRPKFSPTLRIDSELKVVRLWVPVSLFGTSICNDCCGFIL